MRKPKVESDDERVDSAEKIARLLALLLLKDIASVEDKTFMLRKIGFQVAEIASLLGISQNHVSVALYKSKQKARKK